VVDTNHSFQHIFFTEVAGHPIGFAMCIHIYLPYALRLPSWRQAQIDNTANKAEITVL
jgi:hypothetical protein